MIHFQSICKQYGSSVLFNAASFSFNTSRRTALLGRNGAGKTTILRMISGVEEPDSGSVILPSDLKLGYLAQEVEIFNKSTPMDIVLKPFQHLLDYEKSLQTVSEQLERGDQGAIEKLEKLENEMSMMDGFSLKSRAEMILSGLGISNEQWNKPLTSLSGGYKMRAVLAQLLLKNPDYLLLDEPTNHLDFDSLIWLEKFLSKYNGGMLIVSHDRDFLNRITDHTAEVQNGKVTVYKGNYDAYVKFRSEFDTAEQNRIKNIEAKIAQKERFVERFKAKATKATQAQSRVKQIEHLRAEIPDQLQSDNQEINFSFSIIKQSGSVPLKLKNVSAGYSSTMVIKNLNLEVLRGEKVAIIGPNGAGKSTLLKVLAGALETAEGRFELGHNTDIRYYGQHQLDQLNPEMTLLETVAQDTVCTEKSYIRNILGAFLFSGDSVDKKTNVLSGGEKSRLVLAKILASPGNTLLLDEPTNHLDVSSIEMLARSMSQFEGTILFVSHDEFFISKVANRIIEVRPNMIRDFPGTLQDYRYYVESLSLDTPGSEPPQRYSAKSKSTEKENRIKEREIKKKLTRRIEKLEREIENQEKIVESVEFHLNNPENSTNFEFLDSKTNELKSANKELETLLKNWEETNIELEKYL
ncbi:ABC-F family ATP-binding cassette domain-containing protein [Chitinispirillales bacterium ANBcel5]|uniref:ABC-F family ATP-binding cassette domain-containing protein n=1 Tax=Cellulosispirillum alkaliphilum TaxID=3039283 RepID=UPI002A51E29E|nr:ABC-F family ATP-binding cassette domain-containing protein [Chitinispirillales bacterium ANBcel5]